MKKITILFCLIIFICEVSLAQNSQVIEGFLSGNPRQKYFIQLPKNYTPNKKYPLFIAIHWFKGTAMQQINEWKFLTNKQEYILLCPEFNDGYQRFRRKEDMKLIQIIKETKEKFSVDENKVFLIGYSGGAQFAHRFAFKYPEYIKAECVLAGSDYDIPPTSVRARKVKYYVAVGEEDERYRKTLDFYNQLKRKEYEVIFESFPLVGHYMHSTIKNAVITFLEEI